MSLFTAPSVQAAEAACPVYIDPVTGEETRADCEVVADDPGTPEQVGNGGDDGGSTGSPGCTYDVDEDRVPDPIPCSQGGGVWSSTYACYLSPAAPQPPASDPAWQGHTDGAIYTCYNPYREAASPDPVGNLRMIWLPVPPDGTDPAVLAGRAIDSMNLEAIEIGLSVPDDADRMIYVGAPVWLWTANPGVRTTGPNRASATAGATTVTVDARLTGITWSMGDGETVVCRGAGAARGTVYRPSFGLSDSPTCGYRYPRPHRRVTIRATSHWVATWSGGGQSGTEEFDLVRSTTRPVGEIQVLVDRQS